MIVLPSSLIMGFYNLILKIKQRQIRQKIKDRRIKTIDNIDLKDNWVYHPLMIEIRKQVIPLVEEKLKQGEVLFDPQDLEHQILFKLTTFSPVRLFGPKFSHYLKNEIKTWPDIENLKIENLTIDQQILKNTLEEQYLIIADRMKETNKLIPLERAFRGLSGRAKDLNRFQRLKLKKQNGNLLAESDDGYQRAVEFKKIDDKNLTAVLIGDFHYIHNERSEGDIFAFFFKGDDLPWGIETTERSCHSRNYKKLALLANGVHPDRAVELTRYYTLPGSPINSISVIDSLVRDYYGPTEIEALMTCTMPTYAKTKSSTIAGGINKLLYIKPLTHQFIKLQINDKIVWQHATKRLISQLKYRGEILNSHPDFPFYPTFEVYIPIKKLELKPLPELQNKIISFL